MSAEVLNDHDRRIADALRPGKVVAVDTARARARVELAPGLVTDWIPMPAPRAGGVRIWSPLAVGEQVMIAAPSGELGQAAIVASYYHGDRPAPSADGGAVVLEWDNGDRIEYAPGGHLTISIAGDLTITCGGNVKIVAARIDLNP